MTFEHPIDRYLRRRQQEKRRHMLRYLAGLLVIGVVWYIALMAALCWLSSVCVW